jgi:hypothetical protein
MNATVKTLALYYLLNVFSNVARVNKTYLKVTASLSSAPTHSRITLLVLQMLSSTRDKSTSSELIDIL